MYKNHDTNPDQVTFREKLPTGRSIIGIFREIKGLPNKFSLDMIYPSNPSEDESNAFQMMDKRLRRQFDITHGPESKIISITHATEEAFGARLIDEFINLGDISDSERHMFSEPKNTPSTSK